jgi:dCMP deaminase
MTLRATFEGYLLALAVVAARQGTCSKRQVGCVIANTNNRVISIGYNGVAAGRAHCIDSPCKAVTERAPVSHIKCMSQHAEISALIQAGAATYGGTMAITTSPCASCTIALITAGVKRLVFSEVNRLWDNEIDYEVSPYQLVTEAKISWALV